MHRDILSESFTMTQTLQTKMNFLVRQKHCRKSKSSMKKDVLMLIGFAVVLAAAIACFTPAPKPQETSRATPTPAASRSR